MGKMGRTGIIGGSVRHAQIQVSLLLLCSFVIPFSFQVPSGTNLRDAFNLSSSTENMLSASISSSEFPEFIQADFITSTESGAEVQLQSESENSTSHPASEVVGAGQESSTDNVLPTTTTETGVRSVDKTESSTKFSNTTSSISNSNNSTSNVTTTEEAISRSFPEDGNYAMAPEALSQSHLDALLSSMPTGSGGLQSFLTSRGLSLPKDPAELTRLFSRFSPKSGRLDPALLDIIRNSEALQGNVGDGGGFLPSVFGVNAPKSNPNNNGGKKGRKRVEEDLWKPSIPKARGKFSAKFNEDKLTTTTQPPPETGPRPFSYVTDPNIRNHRLYDWESQNFTSIDKEEDLLAESSEVGHAYEVRVPPPKDMTTPGWVPKVPKRYKDRPISMEGSQFDSSGDLFPRPAIIPSDRFVPFPSSVEGHVHEMDQDSDHDHDHDPPFNLLRPREPLRESSTENLPIKDSSRETLMKMRRHRNRYRSEEAEHTHSRERFRPSPEDKVSFSPPVFVDPDQDFFTSTIRNDDTLSHPSGPLNSDNLPGGRNSISNSNTKKKRRPSLVSEEAVTSLDRDPRPYPDDVRKTDIPQGYWPSPPPSETTNRKSDRILNYPGSPYMSLSSGSDGNPSYMKYNYFPITSFGPASNEGVEEDPNYQVQEDAESEPSNSKDIRKSGNILAGPNGEPIYAGSYAEQYHHPFSEDSQAGFSQYAPQSNEGWTNIYWLLGALVALSALTAFVLPTLLTTMGRGVATKHRNDLQIEDLNTEYPDEQTSPSSSYPTTAYPEGDPTSDKDLWTEIKGVYNDVVKIVRGDYGGIVDKLTGSLKGKDKDKDADGPNIVYRDDIDDDMADIDPDLLEVDYILENDDKRRKHLLNRRKGKTEKKSKKISSSINYTVVDIAQPKGKKGDTDTSSTSRAHPLLNDTMARFYIPPKTSSLKPFGIFTSPDEARAEVIPSSTDGFMGEWAKVQLIGS